MVEGSFNSVDPLAYYVNNITDFDSEIASACIRKDTAALGRLAAKGNRCDYDIFICASKNWHGFVLCIPVNNDANFEDITSDVIKSSFDVPGLIMCFTFELCYEIQPERMYKLRKNFSLFKDIKERIKRSYLIGRYRNVTPLGLQIAAIKSSPHRYSVLLSDCIEFSKEFCIQALSVCSNGIEIEKQVEENIRAATASGFSFEYMSRNIQSSGWFGNLLLGGSDVASFVSEVVSRPNSRNLIICLVIAFVLVYPVLVVLVFNAVTK